MELDELRPHWRGVRAAQEQKAVSEETLYAMLPAENASSFRRILFKTSQYVGVYGTLLTCCQAC